jgi:hypothetical protein
VRPVATVVTHRTGMALHSGGDPSDWLFLGSAQRQLGESDQARDWYGKAVAWIENNNPQNGGLRSYRT